MRGYFNIIIDGEKYGVLVSDSKYWRTYKLVNFTFKKELANRSLEEELLNLFQDYSRYKEKFLKGESVRI